MSLDTLLELICLTMQYQAYLLRSLGESLSALCSDFLLRNYEVSCLCVAHLPPHTAFCVCE